MPPSRFAKTSGHSANGTARPLRTGSGSNCYASSMPANLA
jgi:hypothetical protein